MSDLPEDQAVRFFQTVPVPLCIGSVEGHVERVNPAFTRVFGYASEELSGESFLDHFHPDDRDEVASSHQSLLEGETVYGMTGRWRHADGSYRWVAWRARFDDTSGHVFVSVRDVTERRETREQLHSTNKRLEAFIEAAPFGIVTVGSDGRVRKCNAAAEEMFGWSREDMKGRSPPMIPEERADEFQHHFERLARGESIRQLELGRRTRDGRSMFVELSAAPIMDEAGEFREAVAFIRDVTRQKKRQARLEASEARFRRIFEQAGIGIALVEPNGDIIEANPKLGEMLGYDPEELADLGIRDITHPEDVDKDLELLRASDEDEEGSYQLDKRYIRRDGSVLWGRLNASILENPEDDSTYAIGMLQDITGRKHAEAELVYKARHDSLTDVLNREAFETELQRTLDESHEREVWNYALLFLDLDDFKVINDSIGHSAGDQLLIEIADRLRESLRDEDVLARFGGDEFAILLRDIGDERVQPVAERLLSTLGQSIELEGNLVRPSASMGIVPGEPRYEEPDEILRDGDAAMYRSKDRDDTSHVVFDEPMKQQARESMEIERDLRKGLERREFELRYQPLVYLETGELRGFETLVRWSHPERGLLTPGAFMDVAERKGLLRRIDHLVLEQLSEDVHTWYERFDFDQPPVFGLNCTGRYCLRPGYLEHSGALVRQFDDLACHIEFEIAEEVVTDAPTELDEVRDGLEQLKAAGADICIDDFGTNCTALTSFADLPTDSLKLAPFFLQRFEDRSTALPVLRAIEELADGFGLELAAKGVESREQFEWLRSTDFEIGQGFWFSAPLSVDATTDLLASDDTPLSPLAE